MEVKEGLIAATGLDACTWYLGVSGVGAAVVVEATVDLNGSELGCGCKRGTSMGATVVVATVGRNVSELGCGRTRVCGGPVGV